MKLAKVLFSDEEDDDFISEEDAEKLISALSGDQQAPQVWYPGIPAYFGPESRSVLISGSITELVANTVISQMLDLHSLDQQADITVYINTLGGDAAAGYALYDWMRSLSNPIVGVTYGRCSSAGLPILMGADFRVATNHCRFFYHECVYGTPVQSLMENHDTHLDYVWYQERIENILRTRAKINKTKWKRHFAGKTSFHFDAQQALEFGIIHDIIEEQKKKVKITKE